MRINRLKRIQKSLSFYVNNFGFRKPFQLLIDGTVCFVALKDQLDVENQVKNYLGDELKLLTTPCVILEIEKLGKTVYGAMLILKKFPIHHCSHKNKPVTGSECLLSMVGSSNPNRYIVATQDRALQDKLRSIAAVPIFYFHNKGPTLEAPTEESLKAACVSTNALWGINKYDEETLAKLKKAEGIKSDEPVPKKKKKKRGANPLSCKKKKVSKPTFETQKQTVLGITKKKNRRGKKIPLHVKEELLRLNSVQKND